MDKNIASTQPTMPARAINGLTAPLRAIKMLSAIPQQVTRFAAAMLLATCGLLVSTGLGAVVGLLPTSAKADTAASAPAAASDTFGRDTPRSTMQNFLQALAKDDTTLASRYLAIDKNQNPYIMVRTLKRALDSSGRLYNELQMSNDPNGNLDDRLAPNVDKVGELGNGDDKIDLLVERVAQPDGHQVWLISQQTLRQLDTAAVKTEPTLVEQYVPKELLAKEIGGVNIGQVAAVIVLLIATYLFSLLLSWIAFWCVRFAFRHVTTERRLPIDRRIIVPLAAVLTGVIIQELMLYAGINLVVRNAVERLAQILSWVALAWLVLRISDLVFKRAEKYAKNNNHPERLSILTLLRKVVKVLCLIVAAIVILGNLGFDLTTGIAALGIGGVALALGAQKTVENLVGSVSLVADQPVNVGDYCRFGDQEGTVVDIGIRSTRVQTMDRTIVTVPNGNLSGMSIENFTRRDIFHFKQRFYAIRDSETEPLREFIAAVQDYITSLPETTDTWNQARIVSTQQDAYIIEVRCYLDMPSLMEFYAKQTEMILQIAEIMHDFGIKNALPANQIIFDKPGVAMMMDEMSRKKPKDETAQQPTALDKITHHTPDSPPKKA